MERSIEDVLETLRHVKGKSEQCSLLVGSGCSVSAGIPSSSGIVDYVRNEYPRRYENAKEKTYPHVMAQLLLDERREVIQHFVQNAKINWAHICIAQLIAKGYVDRVLTTNFDPLIMRACALLGEFPAIYDFGASTLFNSSSVARKAIFHLHGQHSGFVTLHTSDECEEHSKRLGPLFDDAGRGRTWIVVGYSGDCDPVFDHLVKVDVFTRGLYWVGYEDNNPSKNVREKLLTPASKKDAFYVRKYNADSFFIKLTQELDIFPPQFIAKPFSHMDRCLSMVTAFPLEQTDYKEDVTVSARGWIKKAISRHETTQDISDRAEALMMEGKYEEVINLLPSNWQKISPKSTSTFAWALVMSGNSLLAQAKSKSIHTDSLFSEACIKYEKASKIKSDMHEAFNNWGNALLAQAKNKTGKDADKLFAETYKKYAKSIEIKPDKYEAFSNWGNALLAQARIKSGENADKLFVETYRKYTRAIELKPDLYNVFNNWGAALLAQAKTKSGEEADKLFSEATKKLAKAIEIKSDYPKAMDNFGNVLLTKAKTKSGEEANKLFAEAYKKCRQAEELAAGEGAYNLSCISALQANEQECRAWLELSRERKSLPPRKHLEKDSDLDYVRNKEWFKDFLKTLAE